MIPEDAIRIVEPHNRDAQRHQSVIDSDMPRVLRDRIGRRNVDGTWTFLNVRCANTTCHARILIREADLLKDVIGQ